MLVVTRPNYDGIPNNKTIVFLASGGRDSTAMVLEAYRIGIKGILLYGDTRINMSSRAVVERLSQYTGFPLHVARYDGDKKPIMILRESFLKIPLARERMRITKRFQRNVFHCCRILKHGPMDRYLSGLSEDYIQVLGIKMTDGNPHRRMRLAQLRKKNNYYRVAADGRMFWYPLRDCKDTDIDLILDEHGFNDIKHSGCTICPIIAMFSKNAKKDGDAYEKSIRYAKQIGVELDDEQTTIVGFCSGGKTSDS